MRIASETALREALVVAVVALAWMASFEGNAWLFSELEHSGRAHWIFLPAALRLLAILMFGARGALGLVLGSLVTALGTSGGDTLHEIVLAVSSGLLPWAAISAGRALFNLPDNLSGIRAQHIIAMCTMSAGANALGLNAYLWLAGRLANDPKQILTVFVGDLLGAAIVLFVVSTALAILMPSRPAR